MQYNQCFVFTGGLSGSLNTVVASTTSCWDGPRFLGVREMGWLLVRSWWLRVEENLFHPLIWIASLDFFFFDQK